MISAFQRFNVSAFRQKLWLLPLAWIWFVLINDLRVEWTVNPQYSYGWAVPFLCAFLLWQNFRQSTVQSPQPVVRSRRVEAIESAGNIFHLSAFSFQLLFVFLALLYAPTRLVEEANPGWRLVSWALAIEVVGLTLLFLRFTIRDLRFAIFPVCYFLVAVPWPTGIEQTLIQGLTRLDTSLTTELLGWLGIPAMPHGNVIEVATGMVGIDEACSGIRSFQATLMISLFLGEYYTLGAWHRALCVCAGFALSFVFNLARMSLLVWVAAKKGLAAIASWHDPAGVTILIACFFGLWGMGIWLQSRKRKAERRSENAETLKAETPRPAGGQKPAEGRRQRTEVGRRIADSGNKISVSAFRFSVLAVCVWILLTEVSVEAWYRWHEARVPVAVQWTIAWPTNNQTFKELPIPGATRQILRYDEGRSAGWSGDNLAWQAVFLRWKPGRAAVHLAENHTPEVCMTAAGHTLKAISPQSWFDVNGLRLPFLAYEVTDTPRPFYVFYCLWDDRATTQRFDTMALTSGARLASVWDGRRNPGQRSLEITVSGPDNSNEAEAVLREELRKLIAPQE